MRSFTHPLQCADEHLRPFELGDPGSGTACIGALAVTVGSVRLDRSGSLARRVVPAAKFLLSSENCNAFDIIFLYNGFAILTEVIKGCV